MKDCFRKYGRHLGMTLVLTGVILLLLTSLLTIITGRNVLLFAGLLLVVSGLVTHVFVLKRRSKY